MIRCLARADAVPFRRRRRRDELNVVGAGSSEAYCTAAPSWLPRTVRGRSLAVIGTNALQTSTAVTPTKISDMQSQ